MTVEQTTPYADAVVVYAQAGWPCILPVPAASKYPPPEGFTGAAGRDTDALTLVGFATQHAGDSVALRMPDGVIGIDVDQYLKGGKQKNGAATIAAAVQRWGPLPATWASTARGLGEAGPGDSRMLLFRVPARRYAGTLQAAGVGPDVEIIQRHHRYSVVWPSSNPETGTQYRWYRPDGSPAADGEVPGPLQLAELPAPWVQGLAEAATDASPAAADPAAGSTMLHQLMSDNRPECADIASVRLTALSELTRSDPGTRHDTCSARVYQLVQLGASGHTGTSYAIEELRQAWAVATAGEAREREYADMLTTAARKAVTLVGERQVPRDPCVFAEGFQVPGAAPEMTDEAGQPVAAVEPARWFFPREIIGTQAFDPVANLDQPLAQAVLERTYPLLRYAYDTNGWLLRVPDRWELHKDLTQRAVTLVAGLLPIGDPTAEKGSDEAERSSRRARFNTNAGRTAIAKTSQALVDGGMHPCAVRLADLDADPEVLWAGGLPWNLRACRPDAPMESWVARIDPATPHLHTAAALPGLGPTPLWDAFLEAVWPDEAVRRWALRVLAVTVTGRSDRALPILLGDQGRGKTQVVSLLMSVLGSYAHAADRRLLNVNGERAHQSIVYALKGRRLSFIDEGTKGGQFAEAQLKLLTGGGELTGNLMGQNPISFQPSHTLVLTTNPEDEPVLVDPAIRARVRLIPCDGDPEAVRLARAAIGPVNGAVWRLEAGRVLGQMMMEAGAWLENPTSGSTGAAPEHVQQLAEYLSTEQDPIRTWLRDETEPWPGGTPSRELYQAFVASCLQANMRRDAIPSETAWGRALTRDGFPSTHSRVGKHRLLRIRPQGPWIGVHAPSTPEAAPVVTGRDGSVTGSEANPSQVFSQVNPVTSVTSDGSDGSRRITHIRTHAPAHAHEAGVEKAPNPSFPSQATSSDEAPKPTTDKAEAARAKRAEAAEAKRAEAAEAKRLAAITEASGGAYRLPAGVLTDGSVTPLEVDQVRQLLGQAAAAGALTVDVETTGFPVGHRHYALRTVQLGNDRFAVVLDPTDEAQADVIREALAAAPTLHAHSATADLIPLAHAGLLEHGIDEAWSRMHDTVIPAKLADPASTGPDPSLKKLAPAVLGDRALSPAADEARKALFKAGKWLTDTEPTTAPERSGWAQVDPRAETMIRYAASDVLDDARLALELPAVEPRLLERERTAQRMTARVADRGVRIDGEHVHRLHGEHTAARAALTEQIRAHGIENPGSPAQVGARLTELGASLPRTATGKPSVAEGALDPFRKAEGPVGQLAGLVLDWRHHDTALKLFLEPYRQLVLHGDGRARPTVYTLSADTGRMSCVRPNLQQLPREGGVRACITADPGHLLISADFSGVELRVAAALSQDPTLIAMLAEGVDLHWEAARQVFGPGATKGDRYTVKRGVFGKIYGGRAPTLARQMGVSQAVAQQLIDTLDAMLPRLAQWSETVKSAVETGHTQFPTYSGRVVHMPKRAPHAAPNYCIQGTARELLIDALLRWQQTRWGDAVLFPVHDELVAMVPEADATDATATLADVMATELFGVPILADPSEPSYAWKDAA